MRALAVVMAMLVVAAAAAGVAAVPDDENETAAPGNGSAAGSGAGGNGSGGSSGSGDGGGSGAGALPGGNGSGDPPFGNPNPREGSPVEEDGTFTVKTDRIDVHQEEGGRICADKKEEDVNKVTIYESTLKNTTLYHNQDDTDIIVNLESADVDKFVVWTNGENQMVNALALTSGCSPLDQNMSSTVEAYRVESKTLVGQEQTLRAGAGIADNPPEPGGFNFGDLQNNSSAPVATPSGVPVNETVDNVTGTVGGAVNDTTGLVNGTVNQTTGKVEGTASRATDQVDRTVNGTTDQVDDATNGSTAPVTGPVDNTTDGATDGVGGAVENATSDTRSTVNETVQTASRATGNATDSVASATNRSGGSSPTPTPTERAPAEPVVRYPSCTTVQINGTWDRAQIRTHGYGPGGERVTQNLSVGDAAGASLTDPLATGIRQDDTSVVDLADTSLAGQDRVIDAVALGETSDGGFERVVENPDAASCDADIEPTPTPTGAGGVADSGSSNDSSSDGGSSGDNSSGDGDSVLFLAPDPVVAVVT